MRQVEEPLDTLTLNAKQSLKGDRAYFHGTEHLYDGQHSIEESRRRSEDRHTKLLLAAFSRV